MVTGQWFHPIGIGDLSTRTSRDLLDTLGVINHQPGDIVG
jgi:hypothetical protein